MTDALSLLSAMPLNTGGAWGARATDWQRADAEAILAPGDGPRLFWIERPTGRGQCKWCSARRYAKVKRLSMPQPTPAATLLLGPQCSHAYEAGVVARKARIRALTAGARARSRDRAWLTALVASGTVVERDRLGRPVRLRGGADAPPRLAV